MTEPWKPPLVSDGTREVSKVSQEVHCSCCSFFSLYAIVEVTLLPIPGWRLSFPLLNLNIISFPIHAHSL